MSDRQKMRDIFRRTLEREIFKHEDWKPYILRVLNAGITSIEIFTQTSDETLDKLEVPTAPLVILKDFRRTLSDFNTKTSNNSFLQPLSQNRLIADFQFIPQFTYEQYLHGVPISDIDTALTASVRKVNSIDLTRYGLYEHEAVFLALYTQESGDHSFYSVVNRTLRERHGSLFLELRPALFILDSAFHRLSSAETISWRGMNTAPDLSKFQVNRTVCFTQITSSSTEKDATLKFMEAAPRRGEHKRTLFKLHMREAISTEIFSDFEHEKEVVAGFCSKWKVLAVETDKMEEFPFCGPYHCDYFIELEQLESESLFDKETPLTRLHLLSSIDYKLLENPVSKEKAKFIVDFIPQLDMGSKDILEKQLEKYWPELERSFKHCIVNNREAREELLNFLVGLGTLRTELEINALNISVKEAFDLCENNEIYDAKTLLLPEGGERLVDGFVVLGFSRDDALKLFIQEKHRGILANLYAKLKLRGTSERPQIVGRLLSKERLKHYIKRDGAAIALYDVALVCAKGSKYCLEIPNSRYAKILSATLFGRQLTYTLGLTDIVPAMIFIVIQVSIYSSQLWYGDITVKQFVKAVSITMVSVASGMVGTIAGWTLGVAIAAACGAVGLPAIAITAACTLVLGAAVGFSGESLSRLIIEKLFPDGETEEINAQRKVYLNALKMFNCVQDSSFDKVRQSYYQLARINHPDNCDDKKTATEKFQSIVSAYEIVKNYHEVLEESCKVLDLKVSELSISAVNECEKKLSEEIAAEVKARRTRALTVVKRHLKFTCNNPGFIRRWLDGDRKLSFDKTASAKETILAIKAPKT